MAEEAWLTIIGFNCCPKRIRTIMEDIKFRDPTFKYGIYHPEEPPLSEKYTYILVIESPDKDTAHRRGYWCISKIKELQGSLYWVKKKE